jgi:CheY-like chemotaxis protein
MKKIIHVATPEMLSASLVSLGMPVLIYDKEYNIFYSNIVSQQLAGELEIVREITDVGGIDASRDALLSSLAHELRNPLAPIRNTIELLRLKNHNEALTEHINVIDHQFEYMAELITQLLDSTRFVHGKIDLSLEAVDLGNIVEQVVKSTRLLVERIGLTLEVVLPHEHAVILADRVRIEQVMANLLHNAVKFTPKGGIISITLINDGRNVTVSVKDSGVGITKEEMVNIFKPYYQSERMRSENKGLGVGLDLVNKILNLHNGKITVQSEGLNQGSEFVVVLPLLSESTWESSNTVSSVKQLSQTKKVLVVDDNEAAADTMVQLLDALGFEAKALYHPGEVAQYLRQHTVDVAFFDIGMPEMDGYELVKLIRKSGNTKLPIIALSGYGQEDDKRKAKEAGFTSHLTKPAGMNDLRAALAS